MRTALLALATLTLLAACTGGPTDADQGDDTPTSTAVVTTEPDEPTAAAGDPTVCSGQLISAGLTDTGDTLRVEWVTDTAPTGEVLWTASVQTPDYSAAYQLGYRATGEVFVFDFINATQENLEGTGTSTATGATAEFPRSAMPGLDGDIEWSAALTVDGTDVGTCPDAGDDTLDPVKAVLDR